MVLDWRQRLVTAVAVLGLASCDGGAGGSTDQFCDEAADRVGAFQEARGQVSPPIIGTLRELSQEAPGALRDEFETVTESSDETETSAALAGIEEFLAEECGLEVRS